MKLRAGSVEWRLTSVIFRVRDYIPNLHLRPGLAGAVFFCAEKMRRLLCDESVHEQLRLTLAEIFGAILPLPLTADVFNTTFFFQFAFLI